MEFVGAIFLAAAVVWLIAGGGRSVNPAVAAFAALFGGWRPDPWPRGVQEEDRDRPWSRCASTMGRSGGNGDDQPDSLPTLIRLRPTIRGR